MILEEPSIIFYVGVILSGLLGVYLAGVNKNGTKK